MKKKLPYRISNKWVKTKVMIKDQLLEGHIPKTWPLSQKSLKAALDRFGMVYVKPCCGSEGRGVMRVERITANSKGHLWQYQLGASRRSFARYAELYASIQKETRGAAYIAQQGIHMLKHSGRPFDIRVVAQRNPKGKWETTGMAARLAHPAKIVTNGSQGGTIYPVEALLKHHIGAKKNTALRNRLSTIGLRSAATLCSAYPGLREIGLDIALDQKLQPWILEVNTAPDPCPFTKLPDNRMLHKIIRYARAYGRTYQLRCLKSRKGIV